MSNDGKQDQMSGKLKEGAGKLTGDREMEKEGKTQKTKGGAKEKMENAKDSVKGAFTGAGGKDDDRRA